MPWRARKPAEYWRVGKGGTRTITDGKHRNLNIGTESRDHFSLCSGTGTPPPYNEYDMGSRRPDPQIDIVLYDCTIYIILKLLKDAINLQISILLKIFMRQKTG